MKWFKRIFWLVLLLTVTGFSQIKITWELDPTGASLWYDIYYCSGNDTSLFELDEGVEHEQVWDWQIGSTLYPYFYVRQPYAGRYYRVGIIGRNANGDRGVMSVQTFERARPPKVNFIKLQTTD